MITIYHLDNSRSERIVWLVEELGLPYQLEVFMRENGAAPASMQAIHPIGTAPLIRDGDQVIMESGAIVEYIVNRYGEGRLAPSITDAHYARYLEWLHFAEGSAMSTLLREFIVGMVAPKDSPMVQSAAVRHARMFDHIDHALAASPYLAGPDFTAADIMMEFSFSFVQRFAKQTLGAYPNIQMWLERIRARPAYQRMWAVASPRVKFG